MITSTLSRGWQRARKVNATDNGFPAKSLIAAQPSGNGNNAAQATASAVYSITDGTQSFNGLVIKPYGAGADDATMSVRVIGWSYLIEDNVIGTAGWDPTVLVELACTLSTVVGVAGLLVINTDRFADTLALTYGNDDVSVDIVSPANNVAAHAVVDLKGFQLVEFTFTTGASATSCNALFKFL